MTRSRRLLGSDEMLPAARVSKPGEGTMGAGSQPEPFDLVGCACYNAYGRPTDTEDDARTPCPPGVTVEDLARARASFEGKAELAAFDQEQAEGEMTRRSFVAHVVWIERLLMRAMRKGAAP